jgi:DNA-binding CsgD family transcriptional regulator
VIEAAVRVRTVEGFLNWTSSELQSVLPHTGITCGTVTNDLSGLHTHVILKSVSQDGPAHEVLLALLQDWCDEQAPQFFEHQVPSGSSESFALHGVPHLASTGATYFCFLGVRVKLASASQELLELLVPHMHMAVSRIRRSSKQRPPAPTDSGSGLTKRECEIVEHLRRGANNKSIAAILGLSQHTVRHHLESIYAKLDVRSRTAAVAKTLFPLDDSRN